MATSNESIIRLIEAFADACDAKLNNKGYGKMSESIESDDISQKYLSDTFRRCGKDIEKGKLMSKTDEDRLDLIAQHLGYTSFLRFEEGLKHTASKILKGCEGNWWSIVRANEGPHIYKAPVRIHQDRSGEYIIKMKGPVHIFVGTITERMNTLFCVLDSKENKILYIVLRTGAIENPRLLQGTFSGISNSGDPIAGRELFLREEKLSFEDMIWSRLSIGNNDLDIRINNCLSTYEGNCLKVNKISTFSLRDLEPEKP